MSERPTLRFLQESDDPTARIWRHIRDVPERCESEIGEDLGIAKSIRQHRITRLHRLKWIAPLSGNGTGRHPRRWVASTTGETPPKPGETMEAARKRMTALVYKANRSRRSALVSSMSRTLLEIEDEMKEIVNTLYVR